MTLVGFRPLENSEVLNRATMTLRLNSEDVNSEAFTASTHKLYFSNTYVGKAENVAPIGLPGQGEVTIDVTLVIEDPIIVRRAIAISDQAVYRLENELRYTENDHLLRYKTHSEGKIPLSGLEPAVR